MKSPRVLEIESKLRNAAERGLQACDDGDLAGSAAIMGEAIGLMEELAKLGDVDWQDYANRGKDVVELANILFAMKDHLQPSRH